MKIIFSLSTYLWNSKKRFEEQSSVFLTFGDTAIWIFSFYYDLIEFIKLSFPIEFYARNFEPIINDIITIFT